MDAREEISWELIMADKQIPVITFRGTPEERGRQHGAQLRSLIRASVADRKRRTAPGAWPLAQARSSSCLQHLSAIAPELRAEIEGIADATGLPPQDILLLSAFEYFGEGSTGCTSAGLTQPEGAVVAQNWDAPSDAEQHLSVHIHESADRSFVTVASAGTLGWVGMNGHGLAFVNNDLILDGCPDGLPSLITRRLMLNQASAADAMSVLRLHNHMSGRCFIVGDAFGGLRMAEIGPSAGVIDRAVRSAVHTNHPLFSTPAMWEDIEAAARIYPSSRARLRAARQYSLTGPDDLRALLCDRSGAPDAISKSPSSREPTGTAFSVIFDCHRREALVALGRPDQSIYRRVAVRQAADA